MNDTQDYMLLKHEKEAQIALIWCCLGTGHHEIKGSNYRQLAPQIVPVAAELAYGMHIVLPDKKIN